MRILYCAFIDIFIYRAYLNITLNNIEYILSNVLFNSVTIINSVIVNICLFKLT